MKRALLVAGYPRWTIDLFVEITNLLYAILDGLLGNLPDHIISGCAVTPGAGATFNVSSGIVYVGGQVRRFGGAVSVTLPLAVVAPNAPTLTDPRPLYAGGSANVAASHDAVADLTNALPNALVIQATPRRSYLWALKQALGWDTKADQSELDKLKRGAWQNLAVQNLATVPNGSSGPCGGPHGWCGAYGE